jgi:peptidoglycan/xylan/chitin deacetylase (PgdA/CDA1 family)
VAPLERPTPFFWDELTHLFLTDGSRPASFADTPTATAVEREQTFRAVHARALGLDGAARAALLAEVRAWAGPGATRDLPLPLAAPGVRALAARPGCRVGAHGVEHLWLPAQAAPLQFHEVAHARHALAALLGEPPAEFAYPFGAWNPEVRTAVRDAGYHAAFTVEARPLAPGEDRWALPRLDAQDYLARSGIAP